MEQIFKKTDFITIAELRAHLAEDEGYGVYIINTARINNTPEEYIEVGINSPIADDTIDAALNINIGSIKEPNLISIPPTWIPISLADQGEPMEIFKASGFKSMYERGFISLITKEAYERIMEDEGAQEVRKHLLNERFKTTTTQTNDDLLKRLNKTASKRVTTPKASKDLSKKAIKSLNVTAAAHELADKSPDINHMALFSKYKALEPKLSTVDLEFLVKNTAVPKIKEAAEKRLKSFES